MTYKNLTELFHFHARVGAGGRKNSGMPVTRLPEADLEREDHRSIFGTIFNRDTVGPTPDDDGSERNG